MLMEERHREILQWVAQRGSATVAELTALLGSSESTVRRDLTALHRMGKLIKVHGGATALENSYVAGEDEVSVRHGQNAGEKRRIAAYAAGLIARGDFCYIDASTTTEMLVDALQEREAVSVTNGVVHAQKLAQKGCRTVLLGGEVRAVTDGIVGGEALAALGRYHFTKGFFGANGIGLQGGFSTPDLREAQVKEAALLHCGEAFVLADPSKFGKLSSVTFAGLGDAAIVTTRLGDRRYAEKTTVWEVDTL